MTQEGWTRCPLCGSTESGCLSGWNEKAGRNRLVECRRCGLVRTLPDPGNRQPENPDGCRYYGQGASKFVPLAQGVRNHIMRARAQRYLTLVQRRVKGRRILDVGCAEGRLLRAFFERGWECWGIEHPSYPAHRFLLQDRIFYFMGDLSELDPPQGGFDLIFLWHVLEHLEEPGPTLHRLCGLLAPQGAIVLAVPNFGSLESRRFRSHWFHLDLPWHRTHFTERSLRYLVEKNGLNIVARSSLCLEQGPYGLIQSALNAMGWPRNEVYEALKGHRSPGRGLHLLLQVALMGVLAIPGFLAALLTSPRQQGSVLKLVLRKKNGDDAAAGPLKGQSQKSPVVSRAETSDVPKGGRTGQWASPEILP